MRKKCGLFWAGFLLAGFVLTGCNSGVGDVQTQDVVVFDGINGRYNYCG